MTDISSGGESTDAPDQYDKLCWSGATPHDRRWWDAHQIDGEHTDVVVVSAGDRWQVAVRVPDLHRSERDGGARVSHLAVEWNTACGHPAMTVWAVTPGDGTDPYLQIQIERAAGLVGRGNRTSDASVALDDVLVGLREFTKTLTSPPKGRVRSRFGR